MSTVWLQQNVFPLQNYWKRTVERHVMDHTDICLK